MSIHHECTWCGATYSDGDSCNCDSSESIAELKMRLETAETDAVFENEENAKLRVLLRDIVAQLPRCQFVSCGGEPVATREVVIEQLSPQQYPPCCDGDHEAEESRPIRDLSYAVPLRAALEALK